LTNEQGELKQIEDAAAREQAERETGQLAGATGPSSGGPYSQSSSAVDYGSSGAVEKR
jgi:hypothetical protein